jgi:RpiB/LacA/LacB family sugar-phosphate isomerase
MKIAIGADHNGVEFKQLVKDHLVSNGHDVVDVGPQGNASVDYPDFAFAAAEMVSAGEADRGILICGSGAGMSMAANKVRAVRAALCLTPESAALARRHNDANVLTLAGWQRDETNVLKIVDVFLNTEFEGGRHARRVDKIAAYEERRDKP